MTTSRLEALGEVTTDYFKKQYGRPPRWIVAAPGRVNLIGEHIDYNDGFVLPMAIDRYCVIAAGDCPLFLSDRDAPPANANQQKGTVPFATVYSVATDDRALTPLTALRRHETPGHWSNYVSGVIAGFVERKIQPAGFQAVIHSMVPVGGGLSSSAALEVATATLMEAMAGKELEPVEKALLCQRAEHEYAGVPCGIMDQFASVMCRADHLMLLDCRSRHVEHIAFSDPDITVLIMNTNVKHELSGGEYARRRAQCGSAARKLGLSSLRDADMQRLISDGDLLDHDEFRRARHVISEIERTIAAAAAVKVSDWPLVGHLMYASHDSLRDDYEVSCRELDLLVDLARALGPKGGVIGSRMTGGGFGGCTVTLVETAKVEAVVEHLMDAYREETDIEPDGLISRPARGAHVLRAD